MNVKQLKAILESVPNEAVVVVSAHDHEFLRLHTVKQTTALFKGSVINEDFGEAITPEVEYGKRCAVLLVS